MDMGRDTKPFVSSNTSPLGFNNCKEAIPLQRGVRAVDRQQSPLPVVVDRAATKVPGGGDYRICRDERLQESDTSSCRPANCSAPRFSRKFWSAGEYKAAGGSSAQPPRNVQNRMCVHPKFLHSNATSHKWAFGAVAELFDNAVDEIKSGATRVVVDKVVDKRNGSPALLVQDDGGGMDPDSLRRCMSFGFSDKQSGSDSSIGQYGNGFKTSTMRLGADAIIFSRCMKSSEPTQSVGLLSYTFLSETDQKDVVVPMVHYKYNLLTGKVVQYDHGADQFSSNISVLLKWSPFATEEGLMHNFDDIGPHGTKIIVFNLWSNDDGDLELDFDTNEEDIKISGAPHTKEIHGTAKRMNENHLARQLRYSLRLYASILYLQLPGYFKIILRGQEVRRHSVATDLRYCQCISYTPQQYWGTKEGEVITSIGFLDGAPIVDIHGFNIYHRNRLILPFHQVLSSASSKGRGVAGVLEANFINPTHDKQDFEKSQVYQRLINRLKEMTIEYWDLYSHLIGYQKKARATKLPPALANTKPPEAALILSVAAPLGSRACGNPTSTNPITFASPDLSLPAGTRAPTAYSTSGVQMVQAGQTSSPPAYTRCDLAETRKREREIAAQMDSCKSMVTLNSVDNDPVGSSNVQWCQYMSSGDMNEIASYKQENKFLREECLAFEIAETHLLLKEKNLRLEIKQQEAQYKCLLREYVSVTSARK